MKLEELLAQVATELAPLADRLVFVGGATVDTFITDPAAGPSRFTEDVDVIVDAPTRMAFAQEVEAVLRRSGFKEDMREGAPICRWVKGALTIDVMPLEGDVLGFTNTWYAAGYRAAREIRLAGATIRVLTAPYFLATKIEAFKGRGEGDYLASADMEDIIRVVDGRPELADEIASSDDALRAYLAGEITRLLAEDDFLDAIPAHLLGDAASQARVPVILARLRAVAATG